MANIGYPVLCGDTFMTLVIQALLQRKKAREHYKGKSDKLNEPDVLVGLKDIGGDCIYGGVSSGDENEEDTREWKIKQFHEDPDKMVLVLNPSAVSEAISLYKACHYAIYVDRSFNAAHYLQSEDRIHRLGITEEEAPIIEIVEYRGSIDEVIDQRLQIKVRTMADALNDTSLNVESIPYDIDFSTDDMNGDDVQAVIDYFFGDEQL